MPSDDSIPQEIVRVTIYINIYSPLLVKLKVRKRRSNMVNKFEKNTLRILFIFGIGAFFNLIRKPPLKDWIIIFLLKSYIASILDNLLVKKGYLKYPVNLFKTLDISALFSYLIFPISCIYFN